MFLKQTFNFEVPDLDDPLIDDILQAYELSTLIKVFRMLLVVDGSEPFLNNDLANVRICASDYCVYATLLAWFKEYKLNVIPTVGEKSHFLNIFTTYVLP